MQNDFIDAALGTGEAVAIVPSVIEKIKKYEAEGGLIIYTKDTHFDDYLSTREGRHLPVCHCIKGTPGHDIPDEILRGHDIIFEKLTFGSVELVDYLKGVDFDEVELIGLCTDICVVSNALLIKAAFPRKGGYGRLCLLRGCNARHAQCGTHHHEDVPDQRCLVNKKT